MTRIVTSANVTREQEIGLQLPNGTQIFSPEQWHGRDLDGAENRNAILQTLCAAAANLGYPEDHFLERYQWVTRDKITATMYEDGETMPITSTGYVVEFADAGNRNGEEVVDVETVQNDAAANLNQ